jgi:DNA replication licensing factor MCM5
LVNIESNPFQTLKAASKEKCPDDPYVIVSEKCVLIDQQLLKVQENPESVPTGEIPRTIQICLDRYMVDKLTPGARVTLTGVYTVIESGHLSLKTNTSALKIPYLLVLGIQFETSGTRRINNLFTPEEEEKFRTMSKDPQIYEKIAKSIGSAIYGNEDIKKAIACLLFGGARKVLPDKMRLRGDINILLIGDPSTAKSQFLKFVER